MSAGGLEGEHCQEYDELAHSSSFDLTDILCYLVSLKGHEYMVGSISPCYP